VKVNSTPIFAALRHYSALLIYHFFVLWGGRGSGKSHGIIEHLLLDFEDENRCNYLFGIFHGNKVISAFKPTIDAVVDKYGLDLKVTKSPLQVENKYGKVIFCTGFDDPEKAKAVSKVGRTFIEELNTMPRRIFKTIVMTTREIEDYEVYGAFNPVDIKSWVKKDLLDNPLYMKKGVSIHSTCEDNPFLPDSVKEFYRSLTGIDRTVDYLGEFGTVTSDLVFGEKLRRISEVPKDARFIAYGLDFSNGGSDPHSLVELWHINQDLIINPIYEGGCEVDTLVDGMIKITDSFTDLVSICQYKCKHLGKEMFYGKGRVMCDRSNPANIGILRRSHINAHRYGGNSKDGSEQYTRLNGIKAINFFKRIMIVDTNKSVTDQFYGYRWKKDRLSGDIMYQVEDKLQIHHAIDATMYALTAVRF